MGRSPTRRVIWSEAVSIGWIAPPMYAVTIPPMSTVNPPVTRGCGRSNVHDEVACVNSVILCGNCDVRDRGPGDIEPPI